MGLPPMHRGLIRTSPRHRRHRGEDKNLQPQKDMRAAQRPFTVIDEGNNNDKTRINVSELPDDVSRLDRNTDRDIEAQQPGKPGSSCNVNIGVGCYQKYEPAPYKADTSENRGGPSSSDPTCTKTKSPPNVQVRSPFPEKTIARRDRTRLDRLPQPCLKGRSKIFTNSDPNQAASVLRPRLKVVDTNSHSTACDFYICTPVKLGSLRWLPASGGRVLGSGDYDGVVTEYDVQRRVAVFERD
ncbi:hypothetical protein C4D60_Mb02t05890 [Musa balbisiana]|uniref:Uncharacterized protein n=1 Tax=Musa balbisiana TaxID=52838 RepID=A0A4S8I8J5_MUSBA|nr:hypothetical protein C4D60_Mb02t05890 [Musa balbisiana]